MTSSSTEKADDLGDDQIIGRALRWSLAVILAVGLIGGAGAWFALRTPAVHTVAPREVALPTVRQRLAVEIPHVPFKNITSQAGIQFVQENGAYGEKLLPETMGSGCASFDYDNDGDQDLLLVNSCEWPWHRTAGKPPATLALYRNAGDGNFDDVTEQAGLAESLYGMGVAVGDYDNDGWVDVFISAVGPSRLFHNEQGKFRDVTAAAGVSGGGDHWSTGCGFVDYDRDGDLDLVVCNYVRWTRELDAAQDFRLVGAGRAYGPPIAFQGCFPFLYRNDGDGRFSDVTAASGLEVKNPATGVPMGKSLGLAPVDLDGDGWLDLVFANDTVQNFVFHNQHDGTFKEIGATAGVAFDNSGNARGAMGIDAARFRNNDTVGLAIGNFANEMTSLYVSQGAPLQFADESLATGLGPPTRLSLTFGLFFFDYDLDGRLDLLTANGHLEEDINKVQVSQHYEQSPHLFWNCGSDQSSEFVSVPADKCGPDFTEPTVGRGAAYADIDGDGDLDVIITATRRSPRLLRNEGQLGHHWLRLKLVGTASNRDAIGARVEARLGDERLERQVMPTRSYLSQVELPVTFGLGAATSVDGLTIVWPDGSRQEVPCEGVDRLLVVEQATGK